jgi:hypothetical protein
MVRGDEGGGARIGVWGRGFGMGCVYFYGGSES